MLDGRTKIGYECFNKIISTIYDFYYGLVLFV